MTVRCPVCDEACRESFRARVLRKYDVAYYQCTVCGLVRTEDPHWLEEARASAIADADTGLLSRNIDLSERLCALLFLMDGGRGPYLDASGGYGVATRLMRDAGFDYYWEDPYCENIFARGFEHSAGRVYSAVSIFEVLEHVISPLEFLGRYLSQQPTPTLLLTTETFDGPGAPPRDWRYYSFETGQHVVFFSTESMRRLAARLSVNYVSWRRFHILGAGNRLQESLRILQVPLLWRFVARAARAKLSSRIVTDNAMLLDASREP